MTIASGWPGPRARRRKAVSRDMKKIDGRLLSLESLMRDLSSKFDVVMTKTHYGPRVHGSSIEVETTTSEYVFERVDHFETKLDRLEMLLSRTTLNELEAVDSNLAGPASQFQSVVADKAYPAKLEYNTSPNRGSMLPEPVELLSAQHTTFATDAAVVNEESEGNDNYHFACAEPPDLHPHADFSAISHLHLRQDDARRTPRDNCDMEDDTDSTVYKWALLVHQCLSQIEQNRVFVLYFRQAMATMRDAGRIDDLETKVDRVEMLLFRTTLKEFETLDSNLAALASELQTAGPDNAYQAIPEGETFSTESQILAEPTEQLLAYPSMARAAAVVEEQSADHHSSATDSAAAGVQELPKEIDCRQNAEPTQHFSAHHSPARSAAVVEEIPEEIDCRQDSAWANSLDGNQDADGNQDDVCHTSDDNKNVDQDTGPLHDNTTANEDSGSTVCKWEDLVRKSLIQLEAHREFVLYFRQALRQ